MEMSNQQVVPLMLPFPGNMPDVDRDEPPARIKVAMEYLAQVYFKTMPRAAVGSVGIEWAEMPKLSTAECNAKETAANLLVDYFRGNLELNVWEKGKLVNDVGDNDKPGALLQCIACPFGHPRPECKLCHGCGTIMVTAVSRGLHTASEQT